MTLLEWIFITDERTSDKAHVFWSGLWSVLKRLIFQNQIFLCLKWSVNNTAIWMSDDLWPTDECLLALSWLYFLIFPLWNLGLVWCWICKIFVKKKKKKICHVFHQNKLLLNSSSLSSCTVLLGTINCLLKRKKKKAKAAVAFQFWN